MGKVEVKQSPIKGKGIFATRPIALGETILRIDDSVVGDRDDPEQAKLIGSEPDPCDYLPDGTVILMQPPERYINHGCDPNVYVYTLGRGRFVLAMREIGAGEEILYDYAINQVGGDPLDCQCRSPKCRGNHRSDFFVLPVDKQREYLPYLSAAFVQVHRERISALLTCSTDGSDAAGAGRGVLPTDKPVKLMAYKQTGHVAYREDCITCTPPSTDPDLIFYTEHWKVILHPNQSGLGNCLIGNLRHVGRVCDLDPRETQEFFAIFRLLEPALEAAFGATMVNLSCERNWAYRQQNPLPPFKDCKPNPHVHWHVAVRYSKSVEFTGMVFEDPTFGEPFQWRKVEVPREARDKIIARVRGQLGIVYV